MALRLWRLCGCAGGQAFQGEGGRGGLGGVVAGAPESPEKGGVNEATMGFRIRFDLDPAFDSRFFPLKMTAEAGTKRNFPFAEAASSLCQWFPTGFRLEGQDWTLTSM